MSSIADTWKAIDAWLAANAPEYLEALQPPATGDQIRSVEAAIGARLPDSFVESVRVHDGQRGEMGLVPPWHLLPLAEVLQTWTMLKGFRDDGTFDPILDRTVEPDPGVRQTWWDEGWLPFADDMAANLLCLDLNPTPEGRVGQVITYFRDDGHRRVVAPDVGSWLERAARWMRDGKVAVRDLGTGTIDGWSYSVRSLEYDDWDGDAGPSANE